MTMEIEASASPLLSFAEAEELLESLELELGLELSGNHAGGRPQVGAVGCTDEGPCLGSEDLEARMQTSALTPGLSTRTPSLREQSTRPLARIEPRRAAGDLVAVNADKAWSASDPSTDKRRKRREMSKKETAYLREQVQELERKLSELQQQQQQQRQQQRQQAEEARESSLAAECRSLPSAAHVWERIAHGQREGRRMAEEANAKLREMLEGQLQIARSLERILHKRPNEPWIESFRLDEDNTAKRLRIKSEIDSFETLLGEIPTLYAQVDDIFEKTGMAGKKSEFRDVQVKTGDRGHMHMEYLAASILPFDLASTMAAVWKFACTARTDLTNGHYEVIEATDDTVRSQFRATLQLRRAQVQIRSDIVMRKVVEADRVVVVWCSSGVSEGSLFAPELHKCISPDEYEQAGVLTDLIVGSYVQNMRVITQLIENFLMAAHLGT